MNCGILGVVFEIFREVKGIKAFMLTHVVQVYIINTIYRKSFGVGASRDCMQRTINTSTGEFVGPCK